MLSEHQQQKNINPDEINLLEYFYVLLRNKWLVIGLTVLGFGIGYIAALIKGPSYVADALIAPREAESVQVPNVSGLGLLGGMVASQLNIGGNASLDKIKLLLDSRRFNGELVEKQNLLPVLYSKFRDTLNSNWKKQFTPPKFIDAGGYAKSFIKNEINKNGTMIIKAKSKDSLHSYIILSSYLTYLDSFIRTSVQQDAKDNRNYLEQQLIYITDPLIRAKIQELIAKEVEKMMVVSKEAFRIIDPVYTSKVFKEKKLYPLAGAAGMFMMATLMVILVYAFSSSNKTEEDSQLINKIKKEIFRLPFLKK
jgi:LPS O-antigen subunit length determinant protein (WzzB/FepE family)